MLPRHVVKDISLLEVTRAWHGSSCVTYAKSYTQSSVRDLKLPVRESYLPSRCSVSSSHGSSVSSAFSLMLHTVLTGRWWRPLPPSSSSSLESQLGPSRLLASSPSATPLPPTHPSCCIPVYMLVTNGPGPVHVPEIPA